MRKIGRIVRIVADEYGTLEGARVGMKLLGLDTSLLDEAISKQREDDGGPGSGNWGHKGRPGLVGGSGRGGGETGKTPDLMKTTISLPQKSIIKPASSVAAESQTFSSIQTIGKAETEIDKANTLPEIVRALRNTGVLSHESVIYPGRINDSEIKEIAKAMAHITDVFPCMKGQVKLVQGLPQKKLGNGILGGCMTENEGTPLYFAYEISTSKPDVDSQVKSYCQKGLFPKTLQDVDPVRIIASHELGHALDGIISRRLGLPKTTRNNRNDLYSSQVMEELANTYQLSDKEIREAVSENSEVNNREWFADCITEAINATEPREIAKAVYKTVLRDLKDCGLQ